LIEIDTYRLSLQSLQGTQKKTPEKGEENAGDTERL